MGHRARMPTRDLNTVSALISELFLLVLFAQHASLFCSPSIWCTKLSTSLPQVSWRTALAGACLALGVMFISSPLYALVAIGVVVLLAISVVLCPHPSLGESVSQAIIFHQVRKYLLLTRHTPPTSEVLAHLSYCVSTHHIPLHHSLISVTL